ncbi:MAG: hypothetical protein ABIR62_07025 [Dokdonella sp.]|uniref:hypothetical protein n=1 Tax=Dokdonella sp. TaxID=2291710 RepID=UPI0032669C9A
MTTPEYLSRMIGLLASTMTSTAADRDCAPIHASEAHVHFGAAKRRSTVRVGEDWERRPGSLPVRPPDSIFSDDFDEVESISASDDPRLTMR